MNSPIIPMNYAQWKHCIVEECGIALTTHFIDARVKAMNDPNNEYTRQFLKCYGKAQFDNTMHWLKQAKDSIQ